MTERYRIVGACASPYSNKLLAILRYRRLPYEWVLRTAAVEPEIAQVKPPIIPMLQLPGETEYRVDSTPLAYLLEERHPGERSIVPEPAGLGFLCHLIEDFADEWITKVMFHYRWYYEADADFATRWIVAEHQPQLAGEQRRQAQAVFRQRQIGRMPLVGCTEANRPVIEASYHDLLAVLEPQVSTYSYLFGSRPSLADFALYGQLKMLASDPTPQAIMRREAPNVEAWLRVLEDASGIDGAWADLGQDMPPAVPALLALIGQDYLPFLAANAAAQEAGEDQFEVELRGQAFRQGTFRYQVKCLRELRRRFADLPSAERNRVAPLLETHGCLAYLRD